MGTVHEDAQFLCSVQRRSGTTGGELWGRGAGVLIVCSMGQEYFDSPTTTVWGRFGGSGVSRFGDSSGAEVSILGIVICGDGKTQRFQSILNQSQELYVFLFFRPFGERSYV